MGKYASNSLSIDFKNVPKTASEYDVTRAVASVLHGNAFKEKFCKTLTRPLNFRVILESDGVPSSIRNSGRGTLVMPTPEMREHFMRFIIVNEMKICVGNRALRFTTSDRKSDPKVVKILNLVPFQDPNIAESRENLLQELIYQIPMLKLQLGVFVYNPIQPNIIKFSVEWEQDFRDHGDARLAFEFEHKLLRLRSSDTADTIVQSVVLKYVNLRRIYTGWDTGSPYILFELSYPPAFEQEDKYRTLTGDVMKDTKAIRTRLSYLDDAHAIIAPYVHQVRLILKRDDDLEVFHDMCNKAELARPISVPSRYMDVSNRALFSPPHLDRIDKWLEKQAYPIAFQCEALIRNHLLSPSEFFDILPRIQSLVHDMPHKAHHVLLHFHTVLKILYNRPRFAKETIQEALERAITEYSKLRSPYRNREDNTYFNAYRVTFTPTAVRLEGPYTHQSNRIIRRLAGCEDHFIRVDFRDEDKLHYRWSRETDGNRFVQGRVGTLLREGFKIAGRKFKFLGYSQSQLRSHSVFGFSSFEHPDLGLVTADFLRDEVGNFESIIHKPALYAARLSQAFSATEDSVTLLPGQWEEAPDIERNGRIFTDGVGTISPQLAGQIWETLCDHRRMDHNGSFCPAAFQIRFGGYKGVVAVDYRLKKRGVYMRLRKSMRKFDVQNDKRIPIEIARYFQYPTSMYLNRPFIQILEDLGIHRRVFLDLQNAAVSSVQAAKTSLSNFASLLDAHGLGRSFRLAFIIKNIEKLMTSVTRDTSEPRGKGCESPSPIISPTSSPSHFCNGFTYFPFLPAVMNTTILSIMRDIKYRARIPVPDSWNLVGVADETGLLDEGQVYVCIWERDKTPDEPSFPSFLEGPVLISRSPMIHPGDVRMVTAIGPPPIGSIYEKSLMPNVVIFSCKGRRDLPSCLSGGDLDGDLYVVSKYQPLHIPDGNIHPPGDYPPAKRKKLERASTIDDVAEFVVEYINSDVVGLLSTNHLILSDQSSLGTRDEGCLTLAKYCSEALDYPKTGIPVDISGMPRFLIPYKPDWKSGEEMNPRRLDYYESTRAIGYLFRAITVDEDGGGNESWAGVTSSFSLTREVRRLGYSLNPSIPGQPLSESPRPPTNIKSSESTTPVTTPTTTPLSETPSLLTFDPFSVALGSRIQTHLKALSASIPMNFSSPTEVDYESYDIPALFSRYSLELKYICVTHTLSHDTDSRLREEEVIVGTILAKCNESRWRHDRIEQMRIAIDQLVSTVLYNLRDGTGHVGFTQKSSILKRPDLIPMLAQRLLRAWMAWKYARTHTKLYGNRSFSLLALQVLFGFFNELQAEEKLNGTITGLVGGENGDEGGWD